MPSSVGIAAFVVGLALVIAALVGRSVKLVSIELPDLSRLQRLTVGSLGVALTIGGFVEARNDTAPAPEAAAATVTSGVAAAAAAPAPSTAAALASATRAGGSSTGLDCVATHPADDVFTLDVEPGRRTDRKPQAGMPRDADVVVVPRVDGRPLGAIVYRTRAVGGSLRVTAVYDAACAPVTTYRNADPDRSRDVLGQYESVLFTFGGTTVRVMLSYGESEPILLIQGQVVDAT